MESNIEISTNDKHIHVLDNYYMTADANQFVLVKEVTRKKRQSEDTYTQSVIIGYYSTGQMLCKKLINDAIREGVQTGSIQSLREIVDLMESLTSRLEEAVQF